MHGATIKNYK